MGINLNKATLRKIANSSEDFEGYAVLNSIGDGVTDKEVIAAFKKNHNIKRIVFEHLSVKDAKRFSIIFREVLNDSSSQNRSKCSNIGMGSLTAEAAGCVADVFQSAPEDKSDKTHKRTLRLSLGEAKFTLDTVLQKFNACEQATEIYIRSKSSRWFDNLQAQLLLLYVKKPCKVYFEEPFSKDVLDFFREELKKANRSDLTIIEMRPRDNKAEQRDKSPAREGRPDASRERDYHDRDRRDHREDRDLDRREDNNRDRDGDRHDREIARGVMKPFANGASVQQETKAGSYRDLSDVAALVDEISQLKFQVAALIKELQVSNVQRDEALRKAEKIEDALMATNQQNYQLNDQCNRLTLELRALQQQVESLRAKMSSSSQPTFGVLQYARYPATLLQQGFNAQARSVSADPMPVDPRLRQSKLPAQPTNKM